MSVKGRCAMIATPLAGLPFGSPFEGATRRSLVGARTGWPENDARSSDGRSPLSAKADEREPVNTREPRLVYEAWGFLVKGTTREVRPTSPPRLFTTTRSTHRACSPPLAREMGFVVELASAFLESFTARPTHRACSPSPAPPTVLVHHRPLHPPRLFTTNDSSFRAPRTLFQTLTDLNA